MLVLLGWIDVGNGHFSESSARRKRLSGEKLDDSCSFAVTVACFPAAAFLFSSEAIVRDVLKRPDAVREKWEERASILFPGLWFMSWSLVYQKYLQMQGRVNPVGITSFMTLMLNIGLNQLFIHTLDFGLRGSANRVRRFRGWQI